MLSDIKVLKFVNGEMVIAQVMSVTDTVVTIKNPTVLQATQQGFHLVKWPILAELDENETLEVNRNNLLVKPLSVNSELASHYNSIFGSGLVLAGGPSNIVLE